MTYAEIVGRLFQGTICPEDAKCNALKKFHDDCSIATKRWADKYPEIVLAAEELMTHATEVVRDNYYAPCLKAGFFASLFSYKDGELVTEIESTRPPAGAFDCRLGTWKSTDGTCTRVVTNVCGDRYDNCPSVHAAQWLEMPFGYRPHQLLWMEAGAVLNGSRYVLANGPSYDPFSVIYRCSMCLKTMAGRGIVDLCNVGMDSRGEPLLTFAPIDATLNALMICNLADMEKSVDPNLFTV